MRELSLFTGAGGGLLGTHLLGWEPCGYVEWNEYCQKIIAARIRDGYLRAAPIFADVREFVQSGAAEQYRGIADVVTAGFPCQPFSVAGKQAGADDERNMWPATADVIRIVQPASVLLENVRGLISCGYLGTVIGGLADLGYVGRWGVISAADCGAPHKRDRLWIVAHAVSGGCESGGIGPGVAGVRGGRQNDAGAAEKSGGGLAHATGQRSDVNNANADRRPSRSIPQSGNRCGSPYVDDPQGERRAVLNAANEWAPDGNVNAPANPGCVPDLADPNSAQRQGVRGAVRVQPEHSDACAASVGWWATDPADDPESGVGRMAPRMADRVDRLKAIGNGQVSIVAARAWQELAA